MAKKHQKHTALARPLYGEFHQQEWAILGTPCGQIQKLAAQLIKALKDEAQLAYVDADHAAADNAEKMPVADANQVYTDKINFHRFDFAEPQNAFQRRPIFSQSDGVLVNGNHFKAKRQIVVLDPKKEESLSRKLDRLTDVALILTLPVQTSQAGAEKQLNLYPFLREHLGDQQPKILSIDDIKGIADWLRAELKTAKPPLYGLVLAGGKSTRMGEDKGLIDYHGQPQRAYLSNLLQQECEQVFYSLHPDQSVADFGDNPNIIRDSFTGLGPYGAILSAFRKNPNAAWLVIACDIPLIDQQVIEELVNARNTSKLATTFYNPITKWPAPLVTIWEPRAYATLLQFLAQGYSCPRKVLINSPIEMIDPKRPGVLMNANSPQERAEVLKQIKVV